MLQDLFESIAAGDYPEWKLMIQTMEVADEDKFDFDPLDDTKTWPEDIFPLQPVGRMVLNKNPDNFFNENEQVAYCPALIVPGVQHSRPFYSFFKRPSLSVCCDDLLKGSFHPVLVCNVLLDASQLSCMLGGFCSLRRPLTVCIAHGNVYLFCVS